MEVSSEMDSETPKRIRLPKTKKIPSVASTNCSTNDTGQRPVKKDWRKNMYGYSFKFIVKEFLSDKYSEFFKRLCLKFGVLNRAEVRDFY